VETGRKSLIIRIYYPKPTLIKNQSKMNYSIKNRIKHLPIFLFLVLSFSILTTYAQKSIKVHSVSETIKIDGELSEKDWNQHLQAGDFVQHSPENGKPSVRNTHIAILHDPGYLYIAAVMYIENRKEINDQLTARDDIGNADIFGVQIDPFGEAREGYDFSVTAAGVQSDQKISPTNQYANYNVVWESKVKLHEDRWIVEMKIPFNSFRFPKEDMSNFRINFQRLSNKHNEDAYWNPLKANVDGFLNQLGKLEGLSQINPPLNLALYPFVSGVAEKSASGDSKTTFNGGLDLKYVHKNAYTLDISLIPDFSQAPSDDQIFNLSPFEVQYDENRQFFVEGTEIFDKGNYLYTRRIGGVPLNKNKLNLAENEEVIENPVSSNILNLLKFTGKSSNGISIGILNGLTASSEASIRNSLTGETRKVKTSPLTNYNSIVVDKALKNNSSVTIINNSVLRRAKDFDANLSAFLYRWYSKNRTYSLSLKKAISQKYFSKGENEFGHEYYAYASKVSGKWRGGASVKLLDEKFDNNDFGFLSRNNQLQFRSDLSYTQNKPKKIFSRYHIFLDQSQRYYYSLMEKEQSYYKAGGFATIKKNNHSIFADNTYLPKGKNFYEPRVKDRHFTVPAQNQLFLEYQSNPNKNLSLVGYLVLVKYFNSSIYTRELIAGYGVRARLGQHLFAYFNQSYEDIPNSAGFITMQDNDIIFGQRSVKQLENALTLNYSVNSKLNMNMRLRHYWIQVDYMKQFTLLENGDLAANDYNIEANDFDDNFNTFNIDFLAKWQFAPASEISLGYKLGAQFFTSDVRSSYFSNLGSTLKQNGNNTLSIKMTYFLDVNSLKKSLVK